MKNKRNEGLGRRRFLSSAAAGSAGLLSAAAAQPSPQAGATASTGAKPPLTRNRLAQLRDHYHHELFDVSLPFWSKHGVDHEKGGFMTSLDYDGTRLNDEKYHWYQGRGIWVYSFLYNQFGRNPDHLEIARKAKEFWLRHARQPDGWWAVNLSRDGKILTPYNGDIYGMYFLAEGLQEYAYAANDGEARDTSVSLLKRLFPHINRPDYQDKYAPHPGARVQGNWMVNLQTCTQFLRRWDDPEIAKIADFCVDAIVNRHQNREIGLINEFREHDFTPIPAEKNKSLLGHAAQCLWMVMDEALRRNDEGLFDTCGELVRRHLDVGWDHVYGGLCEWVNVDHGCYEWPAMTLSGNRKLRLKGEYFYYKSFWALNEVLVAALKIYEHAGSAWAARYFELAQDIADHKFSLRRFGLPTYSLGEDRRFTFQPTFHTQRQDNYHPLRRLMLNLLALDRLLG